MAAHRAVLALALALALALGAAGRRSLGPVPLCEKGSMCASVYDASSPGGHLAIVFGGQVSRDKMRNDTWVLQRDGKGPGASWAWNYATDAQSPGPESRWKGSLTAVAPATGKGKHQKQARVLLFGGSEGEGSNERFFADVWELDVRGGGGKGPRKAAWTRLAAGPEPGAKESKKTTAADEDRWPAARRAHTGVAFGGSLVVFGGKNAAGRVLDDTWLFNLEKGGSFSRLDSAGKPPSARKGHSACLFEASKGSFTSKWSKQWGKHAELPSMVVFGGRRNDHVYMNDVWALAFHGGSATWVQLDQGGPTHDADKGALRPAPRNHHTAVVKDNFMFVYGGRSSHSKDVAHNDLWAFDLIKTQWSLVEPAATRPVQGRMEHCAMLVGQHKMLVIGGQNSEGQRSNEVLSYSLDLNEWFEELPNRCEAEVPFFATAVSVAVLGLGLAAVLHRGRQMSRGGYTRI